VIDGARWAGFPEDATAIAANGGGELVHLDIRLLERARQPLRCGNAGRLQQVFLNLFLNARDAMPGGGTLRVATSNGEGVSVVISDTGSGIAQEHIQRIYDPFFTTKPIGQGTGLGLSMIYGFARQSNGHATIDSKIGRGTSVTLYLRRHLGDIASIRNRHGSDAHDYGQCPNP